MIAIVIPSLLTSLKVALIAIFFVVVFATPIAWYLARRNFPGKSLIEGLLLLPLTLPPVAIGLALLMLMSPHGLLGMFWMAMTENQLLLTWQAAAIAAMVISFPLYLRSATESFASVPQRLEMMAETMGLTPWRCWWKVTLPLASRGLAAGALLALARALGEFGATTMVAGAIPGETETLAVGIYTSVMNGDEHTAWSLAAASLLLAVIATVASRWLGRNASLRLV